MAAGREPPHPLRAPDREAARSVGGEPGCAGAPGAEPLQPLGGSVRRDSTNTAEQGEETPRRLIPRVAGPHPSPGWFGGAQRARQLAASGAHRRPGPNPGVGACEEEETRWVREVDARVRNGNAMWPRPFARCGTKRAVVWGRLGRAPSALTSRVLLVGSRPRSGSGHWCAQRLTRLRQQLTGGPSSWSSGTTARALGRLATSSPCRWVTSFRSSGRSDFDD